MGKGEGEGGKGSIIRMRKGGEEERATGPARIEGRYPWCNPLKDLTFIFIIGLSFDLGLFLLVCDLLESLGEGGAFIIVRFVGHLALATLSFGLGASRRASSTAKRSWSARNWC